jgi:hypothetical protein
MMKIYGKFKFIGKKNLLNLRLNVKKSQFLIVDIAEC